MGQALYRKYRPKTLGEVIGQEHVTNTLRNALAQGKISHAYLLTGPRGTGKTSIARILAHEINGLPYDDEAHLDIIEIDAASNRRIDEIRDLRDRVNTAPASAKYKVYIIDEVHMLTKEAFNALLKTLEEPPAHVVFILATTESHKLPDTIVSRTQRYSFRPVPQDQVVAHLRSIADTEHIQIDDEALKLIGQHGEGSFRDSISLLDQVSSISQQISRQEVEQTLGLAPDELIEKLVYSLASSNSIDLIKTLNELFEQGFEPAAIAAQLADQVRAIIIAGNSHSPAEQLLLLKNLLDVPASRSPKQLLEIVLLQATSLPLPAPSITSLIAAKPAVPAPAQQVSKPLPKPSPVTQSKPDVLPNGTIVQDAVINTANNLPVPLEYTESVEAVLQTEDVTELWQATLNDIKKQYNTLYGIARMASVELKGNQLILTFKFAFHQKRINEAKNRTLFATVVERLYGKPLEIVCVVGVPTAATVASQPDVSAISNIFGGAELLES